MAAEPDFGELLFTLSNDDRLEILRLLMEDEQRMTGLANRIGSTPQETSRNIGRLQDNQLVERTPDGTYRVTPYGSHVQHFVRPIRFLYSHRDYFREHTLSVIPSRFLSRIGELEGSGYSGDVMFSFHSVVQMIEEAEEYVWIMSNQILMSTLQPLHQALRRGVVFRLIIPLGLQPPAEFLEHINSEVWRGDRSEMRVRERCEYVVTMSEKTAFISFPTQDGRLDYLGFRAETGEAHEWCRELFLDSWRASREKPGFFESLRPLE